MHETVVEILNIVGIDFQKLNDQSDQLIIYTDTLIDPEKYKTVKEKIGDLKKFFSSSFLTSLQENAQKKQNRVRRAGGLCHIRFVTSRGIPQQCAKSESMCVAIRYSTTGRQTSRLTATMNKKPLLFKPQSGAHVAGAHLPISAPRRMANAFNVR